MFLIFGTFQGFDGGKGSLKLIWNLNLGNKVLKINFSSQLKNIFFSSKLFLYIQYSLGIFEEIKKNTFMIK